MRNRTVTQLIARHEAGGRVGGAVGGGGVQPCQIAGQAAAAAPAATAPIGLPVAGQTGVTGQLSPAPWQHPWQRRPGAATRRRGRSAAARACR